MTAQVIPFPGPRQPQHKLSTVASAILQDMQRRAVGQRDGVVRHSVNDGVRCSGALPHKVVQARKELQQLGLATMVEPGNGNGPAVWCLARQADNPDGAA